MQMRLYSKLLLTCIFQYMEEAVNCSIGGGQNYCQFQSHLSTASSVSMVSALLAKTSCGWSFMKTTQPRICLSTETVWAHFASHICRTQFLWKSTEYATFEQNWNWKCFATLPLVIICIIIGLTEKYFPSWVCGSKVILCWDDGFVSPMVHKTGLTGTFIQTNEHHPLEFSVNGIVTEQWALFLSSSIVSACTCNWFAISPGGILPIYTCQWRRDRKIYTKIISQIE